MAYSDWFKELIRYIVLAFLSLERTRLKYNNFKVLYQGGNQYKYVCTNNL